MQVPEPSGENAPGADHERRHPVRQSDDRHGDNFRHYGSHNHMDNTAKIARQLLGYKLVTIS